MLKDLVEFCRTKDVSDMVLIYETRGTQRLKQEFSGKPNSMIISHLPHGPTAYFQLSDVVLRHDLPEKLPTMSQVSLSQFTKHTGLPSPGVSQLHESVGGKVQRYHKVYVPASEHE